MGVKREKVNYEFDSAQLGGFEIESLPNGAVPSSPYLLFQLKSGADCVSGL